MVMVLKLKISPEYYLFCWVFCILRLLEWNLLKFGNSAGSPLIKEAEIELWAVELDFEHRSTGWYPPENNWNWIVSCWTRFWTSLHRLISTSKQLKLNCWTRFWTPLQRLISTTKQLNQHIHWQAGHTHTSYLSFLLHRQDFRKPNFTPKKND